MRPHALARLSLATALALGCGPGADTSGGDIEAHVEGEARPWTGLTPLEDPSEFRFVVVTDRTGEHRDGVFQGAMPKVNLVQPDFVVSVGDLIEGYSDDPELLSREWNELQGFVRVLRMPFFYAPGNHDMSNAVMAEAWRSRFGPSYYHFRYKGVLFLVLNSELFGMVHDPKTPLPGPWTQAGQMDYVERVLDESREARWTFVFIHQPLWDAPEVNPDWLRVEELLGNRPFTVFAGHYHRYTQHVRRGHDYVTLATTGGGSALRGLPWGEFDHVAQVTMTADGPVIANLLLDGIQPVDVRTEAVRTLVTQLASALVAEPFLGEGRAFTGGEARFRVANTGSRAVSVHARYEESADLDPLEAGEAQIVPPGETGLFEVAVRPTGAQPYERLVPARAHFTLESADEAGRPVTIERDAVILPERVFDLPRATRPVRVDGDLSDWDDLPFVVETPAEVAGHGVHRGPADGSFHFGVAWDDDYLYVAAALRDDSVVASRERVAREQDALSVNVDARPPRERAANVDLRSARRSGELARTFTAWLTLQEPRPDPILRLFAGGDGPEGVKRAAVRAPGGWNAELAVPVAVLDAQRGGAWDGVRLNLTFHDFDAGEHDHVELSWRPSRYGGAAAEGSGSFAKP